MPDLCQKCSESCVAEEPVLRLCSGLCGLSLGSVLHHCLLEQVLQSRCHCSGAVGPAGCVGLCVLSCQGAGLNQNSPIMRLLSLR